MLRLEVEIDSYPIMCGVMYVFVAALMLVSVISSWAHLVVFLDKTSPRHRMETSAVAVTTKGRKRVAKEQSTTTVPAKRRRKYRSFFSNHNYILYSHPHSYRLSYLSLYVSSGMNS